MILPEIREYERTSTAVVNAYIGGGFTDAKKAAEAAGLDDPEGTAEELREISRRAGEAAASQVIAARGLLADGMTFKKNKDGGITESSGGTPQLDYLEGSIFEAYKTADKELDAISTQRRAIETDPDLGAIERRRRLDALAEKQAVAMQLLNRRQIR
jgi:hypothetical protein